jgi:hypothetical protein
MKMQMAGLETEEGTQMTIRRMREEFSVISVEMIEQARSD